MRTLSRRQALAAAAGLPSALASPIQRATSLPNIVFFLVDDLGWKDLACTGSTFYETPNIDALARRSMRFTQAYAACPVCSPTRASILSGKYPARLQTTDWFGAPQPESTRRQPGYARLLHPARYIDRLPLEETTLAEALKQAGYATGFFGKWHLGGKGYYPEQQGFDVNVGGCEMGNPGPGGYFAPYKIPIEPAPGGEHLPARLANEAARFIRTHRDGPFFVYLPFYSVHTPLRGRADLIARYERKSALLPSRAETFGQERDRKVRLVQDHAVYGAMVTAMDEAVGRVLDEVRAQGVAEDTIVVFFSDNGGLSTSEGSPTSNAPLRAGKGWLYEGGIREPCFIAWPGRARGGSRCDVPVISTDFYPTLLDAAGLAAMPSQHCDGVSLASLLAGRGTSVSRSLYWHYPHYGNQGAAPSGAIRDGDWKLIEWFEDGKLELFNLKRDPGERRDLAQAQPGRAKDLRRKLADWRHELSAVMPTPR